MADVMDKKERSKKLKEVAEDLSMDNIEEPKHHCTAPFIPIYPVRYGLTKSYIDKVLDKDNPVIGEIPDPNSMQANEVHHLQQLRQGFVYIYAHTKHRLLSTDKKGKWMVFRYATNIDDANSATKLPTVNTDSCSINPSFFLYQWGEDGAKDNWERLDTREYSTLFVDKKVQFVDMAYSEYAWPAQLFDNLEKDKPLRQSIMTKVAVDNHTSVTDNTAPFGMLNRLVTEFNEDSEDHLIEATQSWNTCMANDSADRIHLTGMKDKAIIVGLKDSIGEMQELQVCHAQLAERQKQYYDEHAYPLTIGEIIHPKLAHQVRGTAYQGTEQTIFEKKDIKKYLYKDFEQAYKKIISDGINNYDTPLKETAKMVVKLAKRKSFKNYAKGLADAVEQSEDKLAPLAAYPLLSTIADVCYLLEASPSGEKVISAILGDKLSPKDSDFDLKSFAILLKRVLGGIKTVADKISEDQRLQSKVLAPFYMGMERIFYTSGRVLIKQWVLDLADNKVALSALSAPEVLRIYGFLNVVNNADAYVTAAIETLLSDNNEAMKANGISRKQRRTYLKTFKKSLSQQVKQGKADLGKQQQAITANVEAIKSQFSQAISNRFGGFVGVVGVFSGLISLSADNTVQKKLAHGTAERLATNHLLIKTAAITDLTLITWGMASGKQWARSLGIPNMPTQITVPQGASRFSLRTLGANKLAIGVMGLNIIAGVSAAIIAYGGAKKAKRNEDDVALWSYRAIMVSGAVSTIGGALSFSPLAIICPPALLVAALVAIIAGTVLYFFADDAIENWVKTGFWGNSTGYYLWGEERKAILEQIDDAKILANTEAKQLAEQDIPSEQSLLYHRVSKGFIEELYEYGILGGLQVSAPSKAGLIKINCAEFSETSPTQQNLTVIYRTVNNYQEQVITNLELIGNTVVFELKEEIKEKDYRIEATFIDDKGDTLKGFYETSQYKISRKQKYEESADDFHTQNMPFYGPPS